MRAGSVIVVMSTLDPGYCRALASEVRSSGIEVIDCPVTGARPRAQNGTLALIAGGDAEVIARCRPALETMGTIQHCGGTGMGMVVKLANNSIAFGTVALVLEAREFARAYGVDMNVLMAVSRSGTANSFVVQSWDWVAANLPTLMPVGVKDGNLCRDVAAAEQVAMPMLDSFLAKDWRMLATAATDL